MRVLVTGGVGFIGSHVVDALLAEGASVVVVDSMRADVHHGVPDYLDRRADLRAVDLTDEDRLYDAVGRVDAVCHQAARVGLGMDVGDIVDYVRDNDLGTATMLRALWRRQFTGRLVVASSMTVYGEGKYRCPDHGSQRPPARRAEDLDAGQFDPRCPRCSRVLSWQPIDESEPLDPRNVYAATKLHTEHLAFAFGRETGSAVCALRYHNVYGPRMPRDTPYAGVAAIFRSALEGGRPPLVFEDGGQQRDFIHVTDVAEANVRALNSSFTGPLNVASGESHSVGELAHAMAKAFQGHSPPRVTGAYRLGDVRHVVASSARAEAAIGFKANTSFDAGVTAFAHAELRAVAALP